ncbi:hypothetical protein [Jiangella alkaliphila]|uniref:hypothetical protein n=1 Tax=Jiangella alkaliphila TaxID=419479 RepID=UPI00128B1508|nr:hypothetical protein [Jiangella alkaliphila]
MRFPVYGRGGREAGLAVPAHRQGELAFRHVSAPMIARLSGARRRQLFQATLCQVGSVRAGLTDDPVGHRRRRPELQEIPVRARARVVDLPSGFEARGAEADPVRPDGGQRERVQVVSW